MNENKTDDGQVITSIIDRIDDTSDARQFCHVARGWGEKIKEINRKYSKPRLKMTPFGKGCTYCS